MEIKVEKNRITVIANDIVNKGEYRVNRCYFEFSEEYTEDLVKKAVFIVRSKFYEMPIINNECDIPREALNHKDRVLLGVYAYKIVDGELELRYSPSPDYFYVDAGSYKEGACEPEENTPTQFEQYQQALQNGLKSVQDELEQVKATGQTVQEQGEEAKRQGDYAKLQGEYANQEGQKASEIANVVQKKLDNGEFMGPPGPQGPPGQDGPQGIQGVPGNTYEINEQDLQNIENRIVTNANNEFNRNCSEKTTFFNTNATAKVNEYNKNTILKLDEYNENAMNETNTYNTNAEEKIAEFNNNANSYDERIKANNAFLDIITPKQLASGNLVHIEDALPLPIFKTKVTGNYDQETTIGRQLFNCKEIKQIPLEIRVDEDDWITVSFDNSNGANIIYKNCFTPNLSLKTNANYNIFLEIKSVSVNGSVEVHLISHEGEAEGQFIEWMHYNLSTLTNNSIKREIKKTRDSFENVQYGIRTFLSFDPGSSASITFRISVLEDITISADHFIYEKFTGGKASPSPQYPKKVEMIDTKNFGIEINEKNYPVDLKDNFIGATPNGAADYLIYDKKKNWLLKNIKKVILNGRENWIYNSGIFYCDNIKDYIISKENICLSNYYRSFENAENVSDAFSRGNNSVCFGKYATHYRLYIRDDRFSTVDDFKNWLLENNVELFYQSIQSEIIELGELEEAISTFEGPNEIQALANLDTEIEVTYALDIKKYIDGLHNKQDTQIQEVNGTSDTATILLDNDPKELEGEA